MAIFRKIAKIIVFVIFPQKWQFWPEMEKLGKAQKLGYIVIFFFFYNFFSYLTTKHTYYGISGNIVIYIKGI